MWMFLQNDSVTFISNISAFYRLFLILYLGYFDSNLNSENNNFIVNSDSPIY